MIETTWRHVMVGDHFVGTDGRSWKISELKYLYRGWGDRDITGEWTKVAELDPSPTLEWLQITAVGPVDEMGFRQVSVTSKLPPDMVVSISHAVYLEDGVRAALFNIQESGLTAEAL